MTTLKAMVRKPRTDGLYSVYIRVVHNRKPGYIKTPKIVDAQEPSVQRHVGSFSIVPYLQPKCFLLFQNLAET